MHHQCISHATSSLRTQEGKARVFYNSFSKSDLFVYAFELCLQNVSRHFSHDTLKHEKLAIF